jgi:mono/diheme cytochrome c family protein
MKPAMKMKAALAVTFLGAAGFLGSAAYAQPSPKHPGAKLVNENNCAACHQIGTSPFRFRAIQNAPALNHTGHRVDPDWLLAYLLTPYKLRPSQKGRMPSFRLNPWEATALTAYLQTRQTAWPTPPGSDDAQKKEEGEKAIGVPEFLTRLPKGNVGRGRKLLVEYECATCHGDPKTGRRPAGAKAEELGPVLREMASKLTRNGMAAVLFSPSEIHNETKMPNFFYEDGEPIAENAPQQVADIVAYLTSLARAGKPRTMPRFKDARARYPDATPQWGRQVAWKMNCAACHPGLDVPIRTPSDVAVPLGYRNAPWGLRRDLIAGWIFEPVTMPMRERMHGTGRMPTFGFLPKEVGQITDWLFSIDGPPGRRGMMGHHRGMGPGMMR